MIEGMKIEVEHPTKFDLLVSDDHGKTWKKVATCFITPDGLNGDIIIAKSKHHEFKILQTNLTVYAQK